MHVSTLDKNWKTDAERMRVERDNLIDVLAALVSWKDYKKAYGKDPAYVSGNRAAWKMAREMLVLSDEEKRSSFIKSLNGVSA